MLRVIQLAHGRVAAVFYRTFVGKEGTISLGCFLSLQCFLTCPFPETGPRVMPRSPGSTLSAAVEEDSSDLLLTDLTRTQAPSVENHVCVLTLVFLTPGPDPQ